MTKYKYLVRIPWKHGDTVSSWNEVCAWALETFGLPGDKFITHPTDEFMDFIFVEEKDAIYFSLSCL